MKNAWLSVVKRALVGAAFGVVIILAGALGVTTLILNEVIDQEACNIGVCLVLLAASAVSAGVSSSGNGASRVVQSFAGSIALLLIVLLGNMFLNDGGPQNVIGTLLVVFAGGALPVLLNAKKNKQGRGNSRITKMVNLYKKQVG